MTTETKPESTTPARSKRGFAAMSPEKHREIAARGGRAAHENGTGHRYTSEEARVNGRKGGLATQRLRALDAVLDGAARPGPATEGA